MVSIADIRSLTRRNLLHTALLPALASCATPPEQSCIESPATNTTVYAVAAGWHTGLALSVAGLEQFDPDCVRLKRSNPLLRAGFTRSDVSASRDPALRPPLSELLPYFPYASYLLFGWGARGYYTSKHPGSFDALRALLPGPAVLLVTPLPGHLQSSAVARQIFPVSVSTEGFARLCEFIWAAFRKSATQKPQPIEPGPWPGSLFFASVGTYSAGYTCNTWTAEALHAAGAPVTTSGVIFATQVVGQVAGCG